MLRPSTSLGRILYGYRIYVRRLTSAGPGSSSDFYSLLGVRKDATQREIKAAYYQLSKRYHPDVAGSSPTAAGKFIQISEAYECLRDPDRRRAYDNQSTGGGGRYPGDPFRYYEERSRHSNPFHSRQYTQAEYQRIWEEFNRLRNERTTYDQRMEWERRKAWNDMARKRAERWQQFHAQYPNGPPGSFKWEWSWKDGQNTQGINRGWELFRKIMMVYFVCFFVISLVRVSLQEIGNSATSKKQENPNVPTSDRGKIDDMMGRVPTGPAHFGQAPPPELQYTENAGDSQFSMYNGPKSY